MGNKAKVFLLFIGDAIALYASFFLALMLRYDIALNTPVYEAYIDADLVPFTIIFALWLIVFFVAGLYDLRRLRNGLDFIKTLWLTTFTAAILSVIVFYIAPSLFGITPKTNLLVFAIIFAIIETLWRRAFNRHTRSGQAPNQVLLIGNGVTEEIEKVVRENAQLGFGIAARINEPSAFSDPAALEKIVHEKNINCIVVPRSLKREGDLPATLFKFFSQGILIMDLPNFYEAVMRKVPLADLEETWFLENIEGAAQIYEPLKRAWEFSAALIIGIVLIPVELIIAILVATTSRGPAIYQQTRVGKNGHNFTLYKFRTMRANAEREGAQWSSGKGDMRTTAIGKFLRVSHLDELPQLWNVIRGDLSFVGPRPERPEFVERLAAQIPYYETRLLIKPGITGWAQLNHRADRDLEDVKQKIQYDIYYLKNRSIILDLAIIVKTLKSFLVNPD
jgi:exopolysaccharide biosynthesis polyprenyl glycosylphosphotransferase